MPLPAEGTQDFSCQQGHFNFTRLLLTHCSSSSFHPGTNPSSSIFFFPILEIANSQALSSKVSITSGSSLWPKINYVHSDYESIATLVILKRNLMAGSRSHKVRHKVRQPVSSERVLFHRVCHVALAFFDKLVAICKLTTRYYYFLHTWPLYGNSTDSMHQSIWVLRIIVYLTVWKKLKKAFSGSRRSCEKLRVIIKVIIHVIIFFQTKPC